MKLKLFHESFQLVLSIIDGRHHLIKMLLLRFGNAVIGITFGSFDHFSNVLLLAEKFSEACKAEQNVETKEDEENNESARTCSLILA